MSVSSGWSVQNKWNALFGVWALHGVIALWQFLVTSPIAIFFWASLFNKY